MLSSGLEVHSALHLGDLTLSVEKFKILFGPAFLVFHEMIDKNYYALLKLGSMKVNFRENSVRSVLNVQVDILSKLDIQVQCNIGRVVGFGACN
jgi:hypothetical protein